MLDKIKNVIKNVPENKTFKVAENKKIINIVGNNSEKRKNEIRQLLCSLYRSNKLTEQL